MIPLIEKEMVHHMKWMSQEEFENSLAVCQCAPGALAVNNATMIGYKLNGFKGALSAGAGVIIPSFIIMMVIASLFSKFQSLAYIDPIFTGVRSSVVGLIITAALRLLTVTYFNLLIIGFSFLGIAFFNINPFCIIILSGLAGIIKHYIYRKTHDLL